MKDEDTKDWTPPRVTLGQARIYLRQYRGYDPYVMALLDEIDELEKDIRRLISAASALSYAVRAGKLDLMSAWQVRATVEEAERVIADVERRLDG